MRDPPTPIPCRTLPANITSNWVEKIEEKCKLIAATPEFGERRPEYGARIRSSVVGRYVIFFRPTENGIEVLRVIAGDRDIRSL